MVTAYATRSGKSEDEIKAILKSETYLNAQQSVAMGLAKRIAGKPVIGRAFAKLSTMPHGVVSALFGAGSRGDTDSKKGHKMPESTPVAATIQEIKAAYPKAKAEFVVKCLEKSMPMASVASAAVEEMMTENAALRAELEEMKAAKAKAESQIEEEVDASRRKRWKRRRKASGTTARSGVKPVAKAKSVRPSASVRWNSSVESCLAKCNGNKMKAVAMANRNNPGLREAFIAEVNAR
jgi:hypothetical protein